MVLYQGGPLCLSLQEISRAATDEGDYPDTEPWVCDGLIQMHTAMKQHYTRRS